MCSCIKITKRFERQKLILWKDGKTISLNCLFFRKNRWIGVEWLGTFFLTYSYIFLRKLIHISMQYAWNSFYGDVIFKPEENWNIIHFCPKRQRIGTFVFLDTWAQCSGNHFLRTICYFLHLFIIFQFVLTLLSNFQNKGGRFFQICGHLTISEL